jgi:hypothetical protein
MKRPAGAPWSTGKRHAASGSAAPRVPAGLVRLEGPARLARPGRLAGLMGAATLLGACAGPLPSVPTSGAAGGPVPARLAPDMAGAQGQACREAIERFAESHTGSRVLIGAGAFADGDELVLAKAPARGADGRLLDGRAARPEPVLFKLEAVAGQCRIRLPAAGLTAAGSADLPACRCVASR